MSKRKDGEAAAPVMGRPPKLTGPTTQARLDSDVVAMGRAIVAVEGGTIIDLFSGILRQALAERYKQAGRKILGG